jgi:hypothetical protein
MGSVCLITLELVLVHMTFRLGLIVAGTTDHA